MNRKTHQQLIDETAMFKSFNDLIILLLALNHFDKESFQKFIISFDFNSVGEFNLDEFSITDEKFEMLSDKIKLDYKMKVHPNIFNNYLKDTTDYLGLDLLTKNLCKKEKNPFEVFSIISRYAKIYSQKIHEYRYEKFKIYKQIFDMRKGLFGTVEESQLWTNKSIFTTIHPFRN